MNIAGLKDSLGRKFRGSSIDDVQGIDNFSLFKEAATNVLSQIDPYETVRIHRFNQFTGIYDYAPMVDLKGKKVIDPRPQDNREGEDITQTFIKQFDLEKKTRFGKTSIEFQDGVKIMRLSESGQATMDIDDTTSATGWSAAGGASGLIVDTVTTLDGKDSLRVNLGATGGYIESSSVDSQDLTTFLDIGSFFRKIYFSSVENLTSIALRIGSNNANYWTILGTPQVGSYKEGINIVRFDWADAVKTGAPDVSAIQYERCTVVTTAVLSQVRIGTLSVRLPTVWETPYYSNRIFKSEAGVWLETPTDENDDIVLEKESENIFFYECCRLIAEDLTYDEEANKYSKKLYGEPGQYPGLYADYKKDKPAEALPTQVNYIDLRNRRNRRGTRNR